MTRDEMLNEIDAVGELTPITALEISIKKWINLTIDGIRYNSLRYPYQDNCALCQYYIIKNKNTACPISPTYPIKCNHECSKNYNNARAAYFIGDVKKFNKYKTLLVKEMQMALERMKSK